MDLVLRMGKTGALFYALVLAAFCVLGTCISAVDYMFECFFQKTTEGFSVLH